MIARPSSRLDGSRGSCIVRGNDECGAGLVKLARSLFPSACLLRDPCTGEVPVLARLRFVEHEIVARDGERFGPSITSGESDLGEKKARFQLTPRIVQALVDLERNVSVSLGPIVVVRVERNHGKKSLARCFASRILQFAEARAGSESTLVGSDEVERSVVGVAQGDITLGKTQTIPNAVELHPRALQKVAPAFECADSLFDQCEEDEGLRTAHHVAHLGASLEGLSERDATTGMIAQQVVDLA